MNINIKIPKVNALVSEEDVAQYIYDALTNWRYGSYLNHPVADIKFEDMQITIGNTTYANAKDAK